MPQDEFAFQREIAGSFAKNFQKDFNELGCSKSPLSDHPIKQYDSEITSGDCEDKQLDCKEEPDFSNGVEMPKYRSHKEVWALKIKSISFDEIEQKQISEDQEVATITPEEDGYAPFRVSFGYCNKHNPKKGGYYVVYKDGYKSFSPADVFEEGNDLITGKTTEASKFFPFGTAIEELKVGKKVARDGWNVKGMWLQLQRKRTLGIPLDGDKIGNMLPYIAMKIVGFGEWGEDSINLVPWLASQTDMLAEDWQLVE